MVWGSTVGRGDARIRGHRASRAKVYGILEHGACIHGILEHGACIHGIHVNPGLPRI